MTRIRRNIKQFLLSVFYRRLWVQIAGILLLMVAIPLVLQGVLLIRTSHEAVRKFVLNNHKEITIRAANEIELFVKNPMTLLQTAAAIFGITDTDPWEHETVLVELVLNQPIFMRASTLDLSGKEIAASDLGAQRKENYSESVLKTVKKGETYISEVKILKNHIPYLTMAVPIKKKGRIVGTLTADVNLRRIWNIVDNIKLGDTGKAFLVSNDGTLIAHYDKKRVLKNENMSGNRAVREVLADKVGVFETRGKEGRGWITSYAPISGIGWGIVLRQTKREAYSFSKTMRIQSQLIIALGIAVALVISILMAKALVRPLKTMLVRMKKVAAGDLEHKMSIRRGDEIGQLIRAFNDMTDKLKTAKIRERFIAIGETSAWIAHELKNSLVPVKAFVQLFPYKHNDKDFIDRFKDIVPQQLARGERMLKELSEFSSVYELDLTRFNMKELIDEALEIMKEQFIGHNIEVKRHIQGDDFYITADYEKMHQIFTNLFINSTNAMSGGGTLEVSIKGRQQKEDPGDIEVKIKDTGKGIPLDMLKKVFEPFHTTKKSGMGLGLAISKKAIEQHNGKIMAISEPNIGTVFIVRLPAGNKSVTEPPVISAPRLT